MTLRTLLRGALAAACLATAPGLAFAQAAIAYQDDTVAPILNVPVTASKPLPVTGTISATTSATASAAPTAVVAGTGKPLNIGLFSNLFVTSVDASGNIIDPNAALPAGPNVIGHVINDASSAVIGHVIADTGSTTAITGNVATTAAASAFADGALTTLGLKADAATCATTNTAMACFRQLDADIKAAVPAGTNVIGDLLGATHAQCGALCANLVVKASAGVLKTFEVSADSTLSGAIWYVIVYDATSAPADGAITPAKCYQQPSGVTQMGGTLLAGGTSFTTGITIGVSTTGCFSKTASTHAFIAADYQ